jgi:hypothetical protein
VTAELQTTNVAYFTRKIQLSGFSAHPDGSLSQLIQISGFYCSSRLCQKSLGLWNIRNYLPDDTASCARILESSATHPFEQQILHLQICFECVCPHCISASLIWELSVFFFKVKVVSYYLWDRHNFEECTQNINQYFEKKTVWHLQWWYTHHCSCTSNQSTIWSKGIYDDIPLDRIHAPENNINGRELVLKEANYRIFLVSQQCGLIFVSFTYSRILTF